MKTALAFETMAKAVPYIAELLDDEELKQVKAEWKESKELTIGSMMKKLLPMILVKHPDAVFGLLGAFNGRTAEEIAQQEQSETMRMLKDAMTMLDDIDVFFGFAAHIARNA